MPTFARQAPLASLGATGSTLGGEVRVPPHARGGPRHPGSPQDSARSPHSAATPDGGHQAHRAFLNLLAPADSRHHRRQRIAIPVAAACLGRTQRRHARLSLCLLGRAVSPVALPAEPRGSATRRTATHSRMGGVQARSQPPDACPEREHEHSHLDFQHRLSSSQDGG